MRWAAVFATGSLLFGTALAVAQVDPSPEAGGHLHQPSPSSQDAGGFFHNLFKVYVPRHVCMNEENPVIWLHIISDSLIAGA